MSPAPIRSPNVTWHPGALAREERWEALGAPGATLWFTGLSGSGKSTLAAALEAALLAGGRSAYLLDGDNLRHGLNGNLGFSPEDRAENVRRTAHAAALLAEAGVVAIASLVSPYRADRDAARQVHADRGLPFAEVWVATPLEECERRDRKGLYAKARRGEIPEFTGISSPYEEPDDAAVRVDTTGRSIDDALRDVLDGLAESGHLDLRDT